MCHRIVKQSCLGLFRMLVSLCWFISSGSCQNQPQVGYTAETKQALHTTVTGSASEANHGHPCTGTKGLSHILMGKKYWALLGARCKGPYRNNSPQRCSFTLGPFVQKNQRPETRTLESSQYGLRIHNHTLPGITAAPWQVAACSCTITTISRTARRTT